MPGWVATDSQSSAVFADNCRLNHSCLPNAHLAWNARLGRQTLHALRDIELGEEVTVSCTVAGSRIPTAATAALCHHPAPLPSVLLPSPPPSPVAASSDESESLRSRCCQTATATARCAQRHGAWCIGMVHGAWVWAWPWPWPSAWQGASGAARLPSRVLCTCTCTCTCTYACACTGARGATRPPSRVLWLRMRLLTLFAGGRQTQAE